MAGVRLLMAAAALAAATLATEGLGSAFASSPTSAIKAVGAPAALWDGAARRVPATPAKTTVAGRNAGAGWRHALSLTLLAACAARGLRRGGTRRRACCRPVVFTAGVELGAACTPSQREPVALPVAPRTVVAVPEAIIATSAAPQVKLALPSPTCSLAHCKAAVPEARPCAPAPEATAGVPVPGHAATARPGPARLAGGTRCAPVRARVGRRAAATERRAHRAAGARLATSPPPTEVPPLAFDSSRLRARIQLGLRTTSRTKAARGREVKTASSNKASSECPGVYWEGHFSDERASRRCICHQLDS